MRRLTMAVLVVAGMTGQAWAEEQQSVPLAGPLTTYAAADVASQGSPAAGTAANLVQDFDRARITRRPGALPGLYVSLAALNALDIYSTNRALNNGAREVNPIVAASTGNSGAMLAVKAATTASSIYVAEKLWKKNRAAAILTMVAVNGATAVIVARNFRNAR